MTQGRGAAVSSARHKCGTQIAGLQWGYMSLKHLCTPCSSMTLSDGAGLVMVVLVSEHCFVSRNKYWMARITTVPCNLLRKHCMVIQQLDTQSLLRSLLLIHRGHPQRPGRRDAAQAPLPGQAGQRPGTGIGAARHGQGVDSVEGCGAVGL